MGTAGTTCGALLNSSGAGGVGGLWNSQLQELAAEVVSMLEVSGAKVAAVAFLPHQ